MWGVVVCVWVDQSGEVCWLGGTGALADEYVHFKPMAVCEDALDLIL